MIFHVRIAAVAVALAALAPACAPDEHEPSSTWAPRAATSDRVPEPAAWRARTFTNPVLPGDHPDMNLYVEGRNFYMTGSDFGMSPNVEILRSTDLVRWERVSRVVSPAWPGLQDAIAGGGTWGGFIVKLAAGYRIYFAVNFNQFFAEAPSLAGPWTDPVAVNAFPYTPPASATAFNRGNGYDDSVFIDDDGKTYLVIKAGQCKWNGLTGGQENNFGINLITQLDPATGMLIAGTTLDLSFVNLNVANGGCGDPAGDPAHADTSHWAEGPTMAKRNGFYYYFVTTHTACGGEEFVWRSSRLSADPADWTPLGRLTANQPPFAGAQHSSAPIQLGDGTWWALFHSYECTGGWTGLARQGLLGQVTWTDDGIPKVGGDWAAPAPAPDLPAGTIPFLAPFQDEFEGPTLTTGWTFYGHTPAERYSVTDRPGWLRVKPAPATTVWVVQKALERHGHQARVHAEVGRRRRRAPAGKSDPGRTGRQVRPGVSAREPRGEPGADLGRRRQDPVRAGLVRLGRAADPDDERRAAGAHRRRDLAQARAHGAPGHRLVQHRSPALDAGRRTDRYHCARRLQLAGRRLGRQSGRRVRDQRER